MGQYFKAVLIDGEKIRVFNPRKSGTGMKLMEHSYIGNRFVNMVEFEISASPARVAWVGDYSKGFTEGNGELYEQKIDEDKFDQIYAAVWGNDSDKITIAPTSNVVLDDDSCDVFLVNHDRKEYIDIAEYIRRSKDDDGWCIDPLPLLTACGNDRCLGDFHEGNAGYEYVGMWAFDRIELSSRRPDGYKKLDVTFIEDAR